MKRLARRAVRLGRRWGYASAVVAGGAAVALGVFRGLGDPGERSAAVAAALLVAALLLGRLLRATIAPPAPAVPGTTPAFERARGRAALAGDLELGGMLLVAAYAAFQASGGARSLLHPLAYAIVAFAVTLQRRAVAIPLLAWAGLLEVGLYAATPAAPRPRGPSAVLLLGTHLGFLALFALLHAVLMRAEVLRQRRHMRLRLDGELRRMRDEARDFRLIAAPLSSTSRAPRSRAEEQDIMAAASVDSIHQALFYILELLKKSLDLHTIVLLWLDGDGARFHIKELASDSDAIAGAPMAAQNGLPGALLKDPRPHRLLDPKPEHLPYYAAPQPIGAAIAVPVLEDAAGGEAGRAHLRAVLCADRLVTRGPGGAPAAAPFDARDEQLLVGAAREILRAVRAERVFLAVERGKHEHESLFRASEQLGRALTPEQVFDTAFAAARELCDFDFAAITRIDPATRRHSVVAAVGEGHEVVDGLSFADNAGLVAMAVKNRHALPASPAATAALDPARRPAPQPVFTRKQKLPGAQSLLVLPLTCADQALGALVLAAHAPGRFTKAERDLLGVIANQVAVSTKNADMYRAMEEMATTDGLTGLLNHRTFQERFADLLHRAERQATRVSLLLTDLDHFKAVNDHHGHPAGDVVLKGVAAVCRAQVRKIDVAARYGGEEFAIVLDGTDRSGALQLAERIRREVAARQFASDSGPFSCTLSLGIACYPDDGRDPKQLIAHADQALYQAKHDGRNRAVAWADLAGRQLLLRSV